MRESAYNWTLVPAKLLKFYCSIATSKESERRHVDGAYTRNIVASVQYIRGSPCKILAGARGNHEYKVLHFA